MVDLPYKRRTVAWRVESMTGARFVHDMLEQLGWEVLIADAQKVKDLAPPARKTDKIDALVLAVLFERDLVTVQQQSSWQAASGSPGSGEATQQPSPRQVCRLSLSASAPMPSATPGSAHHKPKAALSARPVRTPAAR